MILIYGDSSVFFPALARMGEVRFMDFSDLSPVGKEEVAGVFIFTDGDPRKAFPVVEAVRNRSSETDYAPRIVYIYTDDSEVLLSTKSLGDDFVSLGVFNIFYRQKIMQVIDARSNWMSHQRLLLESAFHAERDPLTGLANERRFIEFLNLQVRDTFRHDGEMSFIQVDVNKSLESFSDLRSGQRVSDKDNFIVRVANKLKGCIFRPLDMISRTSDGKFVISLPKTNAESAIVVEKRVISALAPITPETGGILVLPLTIAYRAEDKHDIDLDREIIDITFKLSV